VRTQKLTTVNGFVVLDLDDAPMATGIVRHGEKVLVGGAQDLARSLTYGWASLGRQIGGASGAVNSLPDERAEAVAGFVAELGPMVAAGTFLPDAGKGIGEADLAPLRDADPRNPVRLGAEDHLVAAGAVAAAARALGGLEGATVAIEGFGAASLPLLAALTERGAKVVALSTLKGSATNADGWDPVGLAEQWRAEKAGLVGEGAAPGFKVLGASADVLFTGSKIGAIDHKGAAFVTAKAVVPTAPLPITAKALATFRKAGVLALPDFVVLAGPLLAAFAADGATRDAVLTETAGTVDAILAEVAGHPDGPLLGACLRAEAFLRTWRDALPFGRPLAA
jgi:glutamate dehydrogenase (NAD(P)+)